jgi:protein-tyrosine phosphatase
MAAGLLGHQLRDIPIRSAGLNAAVGQPPAREAIDLLMLHGIDISAHRAVQLSLKSCKQADLILAMTGVQKRELEAFYPLTRGKVFLLRDFDGSDVVDPIGQSAGRFQRCLDVIAEGVDHWVSRLGGESQANVGALQSCVRSEP